MQFKGAIIRGNLSPRILRGETNRCDCHRPGRRIALRCDIDRAIAHLRAVNAESTHLTRSQSIHLRILTSRALIHLLLRQQYLTLQSFSLVEILIMPQDISEAKLRSAM